VKRKPLARQRAFPESRWFHRNALESDKTTVDNRVIFDAGDELDELFLVSYDIEAMNGPEIYVPQFARDRHRFSAFRAKVREHAISVTDSQTFYRARLNRPDEENPLPAYELRGNPHFPAGRANFLNRPALYCSEAATTALHELRARDGELFTVAELRPRRALTVVDVAGLYAQADLLSDPVGLASLWMASPVRNLEELENASVCRDSAG
jgi:RES domain